MLSDLHELQRLIADARRTERWAIAWVVMTLSGSVSLVWMLLFWR